MRGALLLGSLALLCGFASARALARSPTRDPLIQQGEKLIGAGEAGEGLLGASVALSADGETALVGAPSDDGGVGAAWVFTRSGSTWSQQGEKLTGAGERGRAAFGTGVRRKEDGVRIGAGADRRS